MAQNRFMRPGIALSVLISVVGLCVTAHGQIVVKPVATFNGLNPNGVQLRVRSARSRDSIQINAEPIHAGRTLLGYRITFKNKTRQDVEVYGADLGKTLTITVGNPKQDQSLRPRRAVNDVSSVTIPASGQTHVDFSIDDVARLCPDIRSGQKVKITFMYDDRYVNGDSKLDDRIGSRRLGTFTVRWMGNSEYQMR